MDVLSTFYLYIWLGLISYNSSQLCVSYGLYGSKESDMEQRCQLSSISVIPNPDVTNTNMQLAHCLWHPCVRSTTSQYESLGIHLNFLSNIANMGLYVEHSDIWYWLFRLRASENQSLTLLMLRLLSAKTQKHGKIETSLKPTHVGIHRKALAEYYQMSTHLPGFQ